MSLIFERFDPTNSSHQAHAKEISLWTQGEHMLPTTPEVIASHVLGLLALSTEGDTLELTGYRAVTQDYGHDKYEVGAMVIRPEDRGKGYGSQIAAALVQEARRALGQDATLLAFCNQQSAGISRKLDFEDADPADVPEAALALCASCPKYASRATGQICCDTILMLKPSADPTPAG